MEAADTRIRDERTDANAAPETLSYAQALWEASGPAVEADFDAFQGAWEGVPGLAALLTAPNVAAARKREVLSSVFDGAFLSFLGLVAEKGRAASLPAIHEAYREIRDRKAGRVRAQVASATPLTPQQSAGVKAALAEQFKGEAVLEERVSPELLGGIRLKVGDWVADGTLLRRWKDLAKAVLAAKVPEGAWNAS